MRTPPSPALRAGLAAAVVISLANAGCSSESTQAPASLDLDFPAYGPTSGAAGKSGFRFGAASAATQIEEQNPNTDWYVWTQPKPDGLAKSEFVGEAANGFSKAIEDVELVAAMNLDSYRFSIEWARVEPQRDVIDEAALAHYDALIDALVAKGIRPMVTIDHFSNPLWIDDPRDVPCANGPTDTNLCGLNHATGGAMVVKEMADHARLLAERFGDRVDDWCTLNEPVNYLLASYGAGASPPGKQGIIDIPTKLVPAIRNYISAHAEMYKAIKAADTWDADDDGVAASVGLTKEAQEWVASVANMPSDAKSDQDARERLLWTYQYLFVDALREGSFDSDLDGELDEPHPEWKDTLDWLGVQYYFRAGVTASPGLLPILNLTPCFSTYDLGSCVPPLDPTYLVPAMGYEHNPAGLHVVLADFGARWPDLPLTVTESGIATQVGARRAEMTVRALEQIDKARGEGVDVRGYYHWSLYDNFEWALGFTPRFGLYTVDYTTYERTPTEGATVFGAIAKERKVTEEQRKKYGGDGPLTPEE